MKQLSKKDKNFLDMLDADFQYILAEGEYIFKEDKQ